MIKTKGVDENTWESLCGKKMQERKKHRAEIFKGQRQLKRSQQGDQDETEMREPGETEEIILSEAKGKEHFKEMGMQKEKFKIFLKEVERKKGREGGWEEGAKQEEE